MRLLPADHGSRPSVVRALWASLAVAVAFTVFGYVTAHVHSVRAGSPWQDDPYDVGVSFTLFLVPALAVLTAIRASLYRRGVPQPVCRVDQLLRAAGVSVLLVAVTVLGDWTAVALRADREFWDQDTPWLVAALVPLTLGAGATLVLLRRASRCLPAPDRGHPDGDWLDDATVLTRILTARLPVAVRPLVARATGGAMADRMRRHVVATAAVASLAAGLAQTGAEAIGEDWTSPLLFVTSVAVAGGGYFAFCMCGNAALRIAVPRPAHDGGAGTSPPTGRRRAVRHATVAATLAMPVALGMRGVLWRLVGQSGQVDSPGKAATLVFVGAAVAGGLTFGASLARS